MTNFDLKNYLTIVEYNNSKRRFLPQKINFNGSIGSDVIAIGIPEIGSSIHPWPNLKVGH